MDAVFDHLPVGITVINRDLQVVRVNNRFIEMWSFRRPCLRPGSPRWKKSHGSMPNAGVWSGRPGSADARAHVTGASGRSHRFQRLRPNGRVLEITGEPLPDGGFVSIYQDITDERRAQAAVQGRPCTCAASSTTCPKEYRCLTTSCA